jgi:ATP-dependent helicase/nuclease subunit A
MKWTPEQQKVIDLRNRNILVSAAAGSGKTAVLVERIITMISEGPEPVDIDRLLIVTFTNAAAAEMRERIGKAIEEKIKFMPENTHLQKQITLIHSAQITTIHSFCLNVIRNYFNTIHLDPSFRIGDEAELTLLKSDVLEDLLEQYYEEGKEEFLDFTQNFASGKTDTGIEELVLKLYSFSMSYPWPEDWIEEKRQAFAITSLAQMDQTEWMKSLISNIRTIMDDMKQRCFEAIQVCEEADGPSAYLPALRNDMELLDSLSGANNYEEYYNAFAEVTFARLSGKKEDGVTPEKKEQVKAIRDDVKNALKDLKNNYFFQSPEEMLQDIQAMEKPMSVLLELTKDFVSAFAERKADKNLVDFNDLEHFALRILVKKQEGAVLPTAVADELSEYYKEILIDEYQDSNLVQETILTSISSERYGKPNLFMVGDVKQSIYKFRLARPEIFMGKYDTYDTRDVFDNAENLYQRVDLHKNFRSREVVLNSINYIFEQIMTKKLGNINYDEKVALYPGADFGEDAEGISQDTEILLVSVDPEEVIENTEEGIAEDRASWKTSEGQTKTDEIKGEEFAPLSVSDEEEEYTAKEIEAKAIAKRIKELTDPVNGMMIRDKNGELRRAGYGDIVILLRTMSNWSEVFADTLAGEDIPAHTETQSGYFSTLEIRTILNLLKIIDNPRQDIPFAAILRSPIVGLTSNELAEIRIPRRKVSMYEAAVEYVGLESEMAGEIVEEKLSKFLEKLTQYRNMVHFFSIHELILKVLEDTGYYYYAAAMPGGEKRKANMDMLVQRAVQFENTSFSGLFHFVRYIEKLHKYDIDFGEAKLVNENANTVKIMSIHKSKGLEFPIVFVAGMGKNFNNQDSRSKLLIHPDLGLGPDYVDYELRVKAPTLIKKVIQKELMLENLGEELRVLYVAMTRAKEKLILTGGVKKLEEKLTKWSSICNQKDKQLLYYQLSTAATYLDWVVPAAMRNRAFEWLLSDLGVQMNHQNQLYQGDVAFSVRTNSYKELARRELEEQLIKRINKEELLHMDYSMGFNETIQSEIISRMEYAYEFQRETNIHTKLTVSELKKLGQMEAEDLGTPLLSTASSGKEVPIPGFLKQTKEIKKSEVGTLYHRVLEHLNLLEVKSLEDITAYLNQLIQRGKLLPYEAELIEIQHIYSFITSKIAARMREAKQQGRLYTEQQFVMGVKAGEINPSFQSSELVLVQGVIDVFFEEDNQWILLDYKTDAVDKNLGDEILVKRYQVQLDYYQKALEQLTGKKVKERMIYSFSLGKVIPL